MKKKLLLLTALTGILLSTSSLAAPRWRQANYSTRNCAQAQTQVDCPQWQDGRCGRWNWQPRFQGQGMCFNREYSVWENGTFEGWSCRPHFQGICSSFDCPRQ